MKLPSKLKIGGHVVHVELVEMEDCGTFDPKTNRIRISKDLPDSQQGATFFHEILHAINQNLGDGTEHILLESIAQQLYQVFSDNKLLR